MSVTNPEFEIMRQSVVGMEGMWAKMFDPPTLSPPTPDEIAPTNPVPEVMAAASFKSAVSTPHVEERDLMHGDKIPTWDGAFDMMFFLIRDKDNPVASGTFPGPIVRVPRGAIYHAHTAGHGPPPHTIHWHGIEPTPINDGVGHCSMEIGDYTYQWQPNFTGFYFYHCHRNTVQHFEYGLYSLLYVETPDTYFSTQWNPAIPIGNGRPEPGFPLGRRRCAAGLLNAAGESLIKDQAGVPVANPFPVADIDNNPLESEDPEAANPDLPASLKFLTNPHAKTIAFDVEVIWGPDERDSFWSENAPDARATYPKFGNRPGFDDNFAGNAGGGLNADDFFAFNDFRPDYFYVSGVPVPAPLGGEGFIPVGAAIPAGINSGVAGTQVAVQADVNQTILLRMIDGAYVCVEITLPVDCVVIGWDGRALGVPPYGQYNHPYLVRAGEPIHASVARRFDALIRSSTPTPPDSFATIKFVDTRGQVPGQTKTVLMTAKIPFNIGGTPPPVVTSNVSGTITNSDGGAPMADVDVVVSPHSLGAGTPTQTVKTDVNGEYTTDPTDPDNVSSLSLQDGMYQVMPVKAGFEFEPMQIDIDVNGADITGLDFVATAVPTFVVSGTVVDAVGDPMAGVAIAVTGDATGAAITDAAGNYSVAGLADGSYVVTPSLAGFTFTPPSRNVTITGADVTGQNFTAVQVPVGNITVTKATVSTPNARRGPLWDIRGTGTPGATISIFIGPDLTGELIGTTVVNRRGRWTFRKRVIVQTPVADWTSISVSSSDGAVLPNISLISVRFAKVNTRGAAALTRGPAWNIAGKSAPGTTVTIFLGPDLTGEQVGDPVTVNPAGNWKLTGRKPVTTTPIPNSISISSSTGGAVLNKPLTVR